MEIGKLRFSRNIESLVDLDSKELRIGNFVYSLNDDSVTAEVVIVNQLMGDEIYYKECDFDGNIGLSAYGIPLTEEWLFKFGFVKVRDYPVFRLNGFQVEFNGFDSEWGSGLIDKKTIIKYVHQLQNIYFCLFGEELTLKN